MAATLRSLLIVAVAMIALGCESREEIRKSVDSLVAKARSGTPAQSKVAEEALARRAKGSRAAVAALIDRLAEDDAYPRNILYPGVATRALARCGKAVIPALAKAMKEHESPQARKLAAEILREFCWRHEYDVEALLCGLKDEDLEVRSCDASLLGNLASENMEKLAAALADPDPRIRSSLEAAQAVSRLLNNMPWKGRTREQVLNDLGDPSGISGARKPNSGQDSPLQYFFDDGDGRTRLRFDLYFQDGRVTRIEEHGG